MVNPAVLAVTLGIGIGAAIFMLLRYAANFEQQRQQQYQENDDYQHNWRDPYHDYRNQYNNELCSVCLETLGEDDVDLECRHRFHKNCIGNALRHSPLCPMCRCEVKYASRRREEHF